MATTTAFGSLAVPALDDTMEMSSPAVRTLDDDIDIDFEDYQGGAQLIDDERMLEDGEPTRPTTATDDMMDDDILPGEEEHIDEAIMRDDVPEAQDTQQLQEDEELIDYGEDEFHDQVVDGRVITEVEQSADAEYAAFAPLDVGDSAAVESTSVEVPGPTFLEEGTAEVEHNEEPAQIIEDFLASEQHPADDAEHDGGHVLFEEAEHHEDTEHTENESLTNQPADGADVLNFRPPLNTSISTSATDTPGTPTDTGLHPMTIRYGDLLLPLFKSQRQPDGLLKDDNLANLSLAELITNCRQRLALKIGEDVSEDQELVLGFEKMGLMLVEVRGFAIHKSKFPLIITQDCRAAFESSLHDVLEVYLQLHQNEGSEEIPPLSLSLTMQLKFQSSFAILKQAAAGGQGMSTFNFLHTTAPDPEDFYQDEYDDAGVSAPPGEHDTEDGFEGHEYGDTAYVDNGEEAQPDADQHPDYYEDVGEQADEGHEDYDQEGEFREQFGDDEFYIPEQDEAGARLDELEAGESYTEEALANTLADPEVPADELNAGEQKAASTVSSTTVQGDSANNSAGEYDDELIDWDDDSLTTTYSEHDADAHEDFSTFLTEYEERDAKIGLPGDSNEEAHGNSGLEENSAHKQSIDHHLGSEDFLNDPTGQEYGDEAHGSEQNYDGEYGAGDGAEHEELTFDQADTYDQQHNEYHPDYQPGEEDEQYHTAQDVLNTKQYAHGAEPDAYDEDAEALDNTVETVIHHETAEYEEYDEQEEFGDEIGFDQEDETELQPTAAAATSGSPTGKRSFDDLEDFEDDDREVKKARAS